MKIDYEKIRKADWYRQGTDIKPLYISYPIAACSSFYLKGKPMKLFYNIIVDLTEEHMVDLLDKENLRQIANFYLRRQRRNNNFIADIKKYWEDKDVGRFRKEIGLIERADFSKMRNEQLVDWFIKFSEIYMSVWRGVIFHDAFDVWGDAILNDTLTKAKLDLNTDEIQLLLSNPLPSILQQERFDVLDLTEKIIKNKNWKNKINNYPVSKIRDELPRIYKQLGKLSRKYYWLHNDYHTVSRLDEKQFLNSVKKIIADKKLLKNERKLKKELGKIKESRRALIKDKKIDRKTINIINMLVVIARWRDERKTYNQMAGGAIHKFVEEFSKRVEVDKNILESLLWSEMRKVFKLSKADIRELEIRQRDGMLGIVTRRNHIYWANKKEAEKIRRILKGHDNKKTALKGNPAWRGKVRAKAKIIKGKKDFHKLKSGEVLVAPNTRPEYVPIMEIAGAIISEEGGITCHAAIVSRELKKPAVVGVQGALDILKDGDLVEVDANEGIVRRLK